MAGASLVAQMVKNVPAKKKKKRMCLQCRDSGSTPGSGRSLGKGMAISSHPLHYSCLENSMDKGAWRATVHEVSKSRTQRSRVHFTSSCGHSFSGTHGDMFQPFPCLGFTHYYAGSVVFLLPFCFFSRCTFRCVTSPPPHATEHIRSGAGLAQSKPAKLWSILSLLSKTLPHTECLFPPSTSTKLVLSYCPKFSFLKEIDHLIHSH